MNGAAGRPFGPIARGPGVALVAVAALLLAACGTRPGWQRPGTPPEVLARDRFTCERGQTLVPYSKIAPHAGWTAGVRTVPDPVAACLRALGYLPAPRAPRP